MRADVERLRARTKGFALRIIRMYEALPTTRVAQTLGYQAFRAGTSVGAQYREACRSRSNAEIISKLNQEINLGLTDSKITRRIAELGDAPLSLSSSEFAKLVAEETGMWGKVIREAGIKAAP